MSAKDVTRYIEFLIDEAQAHLDDAMPEDFETQADCSATIRTCKAILAAMRD